MEQTVVMVVMVVMVVTVVAVVVKPYQNLLLNINLVLTTTVIVIQTFHCNIYQVYIMNTIVVLNTLNHMILTNTLKHLILMLMLNLIVMVILKLKQRLKKTVVTKFKKEKHVQQLSE
jgi:hypothetical protein